MDTLLDVICQTTGLGFAAVARVTQDQWIACSVRDDIQFGLQLGGELAVETTICSEVRDSYRPIIIDDIKMDEVFFSHPFSRQYGFQSYISFPIILKTGEFFGTLCAFDPKPAQLDNIKVKGLFMAFADLISFHLQQVDLLERSHLTLQNVNQQLSDSREENRQFRHISNHNLQEPLRKLRLYSTMLVDLAKEDDKMAEIAAKVDGSAQKFSLMIKDLSSFSGLQDDPQPVESVDLTGILARIALQLAPFLDQKKGRLTIEPLPVIPAVAAQMVALFYHLLHNAIKFSREEIAPVIHVLADRLTVAERAALTPMGSQLDFIAIQIKDNGIGIAENQLEWIFRIFAQLSPTQSAPGEGFGLAYCRKIVRTHSGAITATSTIGVGTTVTVLLPQTL